MVDEPSPSEAPPGATLDDAELLLDGAGRAEAEKEVSASFKRYQDTLPAEGYAH